MFLAKAAVRSKFVEDHAISSRIHDLALQLYYQSIMYYHLALELAEYPKLKSSATGVELTKDL
jgi:hypothetical protein